MSRSVFSQWTAFQKATELANAIFQVSLQFPREERYSLTDQIRRSSRSVCANMAEASAKRRYGKNWVSKLTDCAAEAAETQVWLSFAHTYADIDRETYEKLISLNEEVAKLISYMIANPKRFGAVSLYQRNL